MSEITKTVREKDQQTVTHWFTFLTFSCKERPCLEMNLNWSVENLKPSKTSSSNWMSTILVPITQNMHLKFNWESIGRYFAWNKSNLFLWRNIVQGNGCMQMVKHAWFCILWTFVFFYSLISKFSDIERKFHEERNVFNSGWIFFNRGNNNKTARFLPF